MSQPTTLLTPEDFWQQLQFRDHDELTRARRNLWLVPLEGVCLITGGLLVLALISNFMRHVAIPTAYGPITVPTIITILMATGMASFAAFQLLMTFIMAVRAAAHFTFRNPRNAIISGVLTALALWYL
jgi:hypothetical protein